jgi:hypothetical protein
MHNIGSSFEIARTKLCHATIIPQMQLVMMIGCFDVVKKTMRW